MHPDHNMNPDTNRLNTHCLCKLAEEWAAYAAA